MKQQVEDALNTLDRSEMVVPIAAMTMHQLRLQSQCHHSGTMTTSAVMEGGTAEDSLNVTTANLASTSGMSTAPLQNDSKIVSTTMEMEGVTIIAKCDEGTISRTQTRAHQGSVKQPL